MGGGWRCGEHVSRKRVGGVDKWNSVLFQHSLSEAGCVCVCCEKEKRVGNGVCPLSIEWKLYAHILF